MIRAMLSIHKAHKLSLTYLRPRYTKLSTSYQALQRNMENRKQHYVPQCYLRNFSPNNKNLYIYDKVVSRQYGKAVGNVAYKEYFYKLPEKFIENISDIPSGTQFYEKEFFAESIENQYNIILRHIIKKGKSFLENRNIDEIINQREKELFAQLIAIQYLRMPDLREKYSDAHKKDISLSSEIIKAFLTHNNPELKGEIENLHISYDEAYDPILHSDMYAGEEFYVEIANQIMNKHWVYFIAEEGSFYTSDNPIIIKPHIQNQRPFYEGFGMRGVEIIFPISSSVLLTMWDSNYFVEMEKTPDSFNIISDKERREYNCLQYMFSNRQTYSFNDDFSLIETLKVCNNGKEYFRNKSKILVNGK